jgi:aspartyl protease family protein
MSDKRGPWDLPETPAPPTGRHPARPPVEPRRLWLWLIVLAAVGALTFGLARAYPEALHDSEDKTRLALQLGIVLLVSTALLRGLRGPIRQHLKHVALWSGIIAILVLGYAYRAELAAVPRRVALAFNVGTPVQTGERTLVVPQGEDGSFVVDALINGQRVRFVVDTGATETVLTPDDARRLGIPVDTLNYGYKAETANGVGYSAAYDVDSLAVGAIKLDGFRVMVNQAPMRLSLLGMSFLHRLDAFEFRDRQLILKWREDGKGRAF